MPESWEIEDFRRKAAAGELTVAYECHYVEFDELGNYFGDWEQEYWDPSGVIGFVGSVIRGAHKLVQLEEYGLAFNALGMIIDLEFQIAETEASEDLCEEECFTLDMAVSEGLLSVDRAEVFREYALCCMNALDSREDAAAKIISAAQLPLFEKCRPCDFLDVVDDEALLTELYTQAAEILIPLEAKHLPTKESDRYRSWAYEDFCKMDVLRAIVEYLQERGVEGTQPSFLKCVWLRIMNLLSDLSMEPYIDDQVEISMIWHIVEALIERGRFEEEAWELKAAIMAQIFQNGYFDEFGVSDPMSDLVQAVCVSAEERRKCAELMERIGGYCLEKEAAAIYKELGDEEKYISFYEKRLGKEREPAPYLLVADYYKDKDMNKTLEISRLALQKCRGDQTQFLVYLLQDAKDRGDEQAFEKLMQSARRRSYVNDKLIEEMFG